MNDCLLHPGAPAAGLCDYCRQPHCEACLQPLLGRSYCPACVGPVRAVVEGKAVRVEVPFPGSVPAPPPPAARVSRVPGWLSGILYLLVYVVLVELLGSQLLILPLAVAQLATGRFPPARLDEAVLFDTSALGPARWALLFAIFAWGMLGLTLLVTWAFARGVERRSLGDLGLRWSPAMPWNLSMGLALAALLFVSVVGTGALHGWYVVRLAAEGRQAIVLTVAAFLLLLPLAAVEEIAMRGCLLNAFRRSWGRRGAVAGSTVAFALLHALNPGFSENPLAIVGLLLAGFYLASAYLITGDLWLAIFLHTGWNLMEGPVFGLPVSGMPVPLTVFRTTAPGPSLWTGGTFGPEAGLLLCLLMGVHIAALWAMRPMLASRAQAEAARG